MGYYYSGNNFYTSDASFSAEFAQKVSTTYNLAYDADAGATQPQSSYKAGSAIQLFYPGFNDAWGFLNVPMATDSGVCNDAASALFLSSQESTCVHALTSTTGLCASGSVFDPNFWIKSVRVLSNPGTSSTAYVTATVSQPMLVDASGSGNPELICYLSGALTSCSTVGSSSDFSPLVSSIDSPTLPGPTVSGSVCEQAVSAVSITLLYSQTSSAVTGIVYQFTYAELPTADLSKYAQKFNTSYLPDTQAQNLYKSGNPGYLLGAPVRFGAAVTNGSSSAVSFNLDPLQALTLARDVSATVSGSSVMSCAASADYSQRVSVPFGTSMTSGCTLWYTYAELTNNCDAIRSTVYATQVGSFFSSIDRVGIFGNASWLDSSDWIEILNMDPPSAITTDSTTSQNGLCAQLMTGYNIEFLWAEFGSVANPQPGIVGARVSYVQGAFRYSCSGAVGSAACKSASASVYQPFRIQSTVSWVQTGSPAAAFIPPAPPIISAIPNDVFYPFRISSSSVRRFIVSTKLAPALTALALLRLLWV